MAHVRFVRGVRQLECVGSDRAGTGTTPRTVPIEIERPPSTPGTACPGGCSLEADAAVDRPSRHNYRPFREFSPSQTVSQGLSVFDAETRQNPSADVRWSEDHGVAHYNTPFTRKNVAEYHRAFC